MPLERVLDPEVMDTPREAEEYDSMDHSEVNRLFVSDLLKDLPPELLGEDLDVLDLGTGTAQIPVEFCRQSEDGRIMAVDLAVSMLDVARYNIEVAGVTERVLLQHVDAKALPFEDGSFRCVISNSIVHHIPHPEAVLREAVRTLAPGGWIFFRDLLRPESDDQVRHLVQTYTGQETEFQQKMFEDSLRAALSLDELREMVEPLGFSATTIQATSDRHWTWSGRRE